MVAPSTNSVVPTQPLATLSPANYSFLQDQIYRDSGIVLDETKLYLIEARLLPIVRGKKLDSLDSLCALLRSPQSTALRTEVVEAMTTNETLFFRDPAVFTALQTLVLPDLIKRQAATRRLSFWSAAASSGQEAYTIAMILKEMGLAGWDLKVFGTDLNTQILDRARSGKYLQIEVNRGLPAKYLVKYFQREGLEWRVSDEIRRMVEFKTFDLRQSAQGFGPFDIIFCRNVLIYFDVETKKKILAGMRRALKPKGLLLLGSAETTLNLDTAFTRKVIGNSGFYEAP